MSDPLPQRAGPVVLRRLHPTDLAAFQAYRQDPVLARYQGWVATPDQEALGFLTHMNRAPLLQAGTWCQIGIAEAESNCLIGDIGLLLSSDATQAEIGFTLRRESQGRGMATAAVRGAIALVFDHTPARRAIAAADARNAESIRLLERVGMRLLATRDIDALGGAYTECVHAIDRDS